MNPITILDKLNPLIKLLRLEEFNNVQPLVKICQKIGFNCQPAHLVLVSGIVALFLFITSMASYLLSSLIGFLYPAYMSFKAIQSTDKEDDKQWLTYWVVFSIFQIFDGLLSSILSFLPFYYIFKVAFYVYLFHPKTKGANLIYTKLVNPLLSKHQVFIDSKLSSNSKWEQSIIQKSFVASPLFFFIFFLLYVKNLCILTARPLYIYVSKKVINLCLIKTKANIYVPKN